MKKRIIAAAATILAIALCTGNARGQGFGGINFQELFQMLDANSDQVIQRGEVPESGRAAFDRLAKVADSNKDGKIDLQEYRAALVRVRESMGGGAGQNVRSFEAMDKNKDGKLTREEFTGLAPFVRVDADGDGFITREELAKFRSQAGNAMNPSQVAQRLKAMDKNNDGKVSREEFTGPPAIFNRLDRNRDSVVDENEIRQFLSGDAAEPKKADRRGDKPASDKQSEPKGDPSKQNSAK
jgi:Ca2+-binding EF-hand superfamily protein